MVSGVRLAEFEHFARQGGDAAQKKITLPFHELAALDADRDAGGDGVGQIEIVLAELLLNRPAVARYGLHTDDVAEAIETSFAGAVVGRIFDRGSALTTSGPIWLLPFTVRRTV